MDQRPLTSPAERPRARTAALVTLGCKVNQAEVRAWGAHLARAGLTIVEPGRPADLTIVNTCTVTSDGDRASRQRIRQAARAGDDGYVVVTGCYAQADAEAVAALPGVDLVVPNDDKDALLDRLADVGLVAPVDEDPAAWVHRSERPDWVTRLPALERKARAFVKVQDGCNAHCTYCIVPRARGPQRSRSIDAIVNEIRILHHLGYREAVLTGVQIGAYGSDWDPATRRVAHRRAPTLTHLVERVLAETPMPRIRISSIQPQDWPEGFLELWQDRRMCRHLHLPLQSGSDTVLKRMVRRYRTADFRALVERLRAASPEVALTADVMVGFPGETDQEHDDSVAFIREMAFAEQHIFRYSSRPGTAAARLSDDVPPEVKKRRSAELHALDRELRAAYQSRFLGRTMEVLWEEAVGTPTQPSRIEGEGSVSPRGVVASPLPARMGKGPADGRDAPRWSGLTDNYLRVVARGNDLEGRLMIVRLEERAEDGMRGQIL